MKLIERTKCPICSCLNYKSLFKISYNDASVLNFLNEYYSGRMPVNFLKDYNYELMECTNCRLIFQKYIPDDQFSMELYDKIISSEESLKKKLDNKYLNLQYDNEIKLIKNIFKEKKIKALEFGAGWGFWASRAIEKGLDVDAFELSNEGMEFNQAKINGAPPMQ